MAKAQEHGEAGTHLVEAASLRTLICRLFTAAGAPSEDAETVAEVLVEADLRGVESHGSTRVAGYLSMIRHGLLNPRPKIQILRETDSMAMLEGDQAFGIVVARRAMEMAIDKGRRSGIACVTARNVTHTGMVGFYPMMAAQRGLIGLSCNNGPTILPPFGGKTPTLATNPISVAVPSKRENPIVLDMATSVVAAGKLRQAGVIVFLLPFAQRRRRIAFQELAQFLSLTGGFDKRMKQPRGAAWPSRTVNPHGL